MDYACANMSQAMSVKLYVEIFLMTWIVHVLQDMIDHNCSGLKCMWCDCLVKNADAVE